MFCQKCGAENADDATFCNKCGAAMKAETKDDAVLHEIAQARKETNDLKKNAIIIAFVLIVAAVGFVATDNIGHSAQLQVTVHSLHVTETIDVQITVDGKVVHTFHNLEPDHYMWNAKYIKVYFSGFDKSKLITIKAISTGGGLGSTSATKELIIENDQKYSIDFYL